jgi:fructokinase
MIVVAGENLVDLVVDRDGAVTARPGGGPYNTARAVARLGEPCAYLGAVSTDAFGRAIAEHLRLDEVDDRLLARRREPTTLAVAEIDGNGAATYNFYHHGTAAPHVDLSLLEGLADIDAVHAGTLGFVWQPIAHALTTLVLNLDPDVTVMIDPNCRPAAVNDPATYRQRLDTVLKRATIVKVSTDDLDFLYPDCTPDEGVQRLIGLGASVVLLTAGGDQVTVTTAQATRSVTPPSVAVVDSIGAGDAFGGAFLAYWVRHGWSAAQIPSIEELTAATEFGCLVGARTCEVVGAEPPMAATLPAF